ncbi:MAG: S41 family peptidase [Janthinobacterium lividum]
MKYLFLVGALLALQPRAARSQTLQNGSFETPQPGNRQLPASWDIAAAPGYAIALDSTAAQSGRRALHLASTTDDPKGFQPFRQSVAVQVAHPTILRLRATVKASEANSVALLCQYWDETKMVGLTNSLMQGAPPVGTGEWRTLDLSLLVLPTMRRVVVGGFYLGKGQAWFDEVQLSEPASYPATAPSAAVQTYLKDAVDLARTHALVRDSIDWPATQRELLAMAHGMQTPAETYPVFSYLLGVLRQYGDRHSQFRTPATVSAYQAPATAANAVTIAEPSARYLGEGLAYVAVPGFGSGNAERQLAFANRLQELIHQLDTEHAITGWVVDLRGNGGGNMYPMLTGLGPLTGAGTLGYFVSGHQEQPIAYRDGEAYAGKPGHGVRVPQPYQLRRPASPVAVLIGPRTASSGEITAMAFMGRPATRLFGQASAGFTTANQLFRLSDGAELNLAVSTEADRTHRQHMGPIVPDETVSAAASAGSDATLQAASVWLRK